MATLRLLRTPKLLPIDRLTKRHSAMVGGLALHAPGWLYAGMWYDRDAPASTGVPTDTEVYDDYNQ